MHVVGVVGLAGVDGDEVVGEKDSIPKLRSLNLELVFLSRIHLDILATWKDTIELHKAIQKAEKLFSKMMTVPELICDEDHIVEALKIAATAEHPVYDCLFIAMGRSLNAPILTADKKLRRKFPDDKFVAI